MTINVREMKRTKGKRTTRRVQIPSVFGTILREWLDIHPGGDMLFTHSEEVPRSKKCSGTTGYSNPRSRPMPLPKVGRH